MDQPQARYEYEFVDLMMERQSVMDCLSTIVYLFSKNERVVGSVTPERCQGCHLSHVLIFIVRRRLILFDKKKSAAAGDLV